MPTEKKMLLLAGGDPAILEMWRRLPGQRGDGREGALTASEVHHEKNPVRG